MGRGAIGAGSVSNLESFLECIINQNSLLLFSSVPVVCQVEGRIVDGMTTILIPKNGSKGLDDYFGIGKMSGNNGAWD